jgi:phenylpropionate dioxygenase-like ring-hydroxylating dioxygenase large terminal subunit
MASEPPESGFAEKVKTKAYPTHEWGGFVWTYMGPRETMPAFEPPAFAPTADCEVAIAKIHVNCNWAQILEGQIDSAHSSSLHSSDMRPARVDAAKAVETHWLRPSTDKAPRMQVERTSFGFHYAAIRRPILNAAQQDYVRKTVYIAPFTALIPPNNQYNVTTVLAPTDDTHTAFHFIAWREKGNIDQEAWRKFNVAQPGIDVDHEFRSFRTRDNDYKQDRSAMKLGDFTGIRGIPNQDIAMWETMGPIADRTRERLGASDLAVVEFRRLMVDAARAFAERRDGVERAAIVEAVCRRLHDDGAGDAEPPTHFLIGADAGIRRCHRRRRCGREAPVVEMDVGIAEASGRLEMWIGWALLGHGVSSRDWRLSSPRRHLCCRTPRCRRCRPDTSRRPGRSAVWPALRALDRETPRNGRSGDSRSGRR